MAKFRQWVVVDPKGNILQGTNAKSEKYSRYRYIRDTRPDLRLPLIPSAEFYRLAEEHFTILDKQGCRCIRVAMREVG